MAKTLQSALQETFMSTLRSITAPNTGVLGDPRWVPLIIITGESNSGGIGANSDATPTEQAPHHSVQILNNTTMLWEDMQIGVNNLIGHSGLESYASSSHGWELVLADSVEAGQWLDNPVYLVKTGQGASTIAQWDVGQSYWTTFNTRVDAALALIASAGKIPLIYMFYTQGINDALGGTNEATWKQKTIDHIAKIRVKLGNIPIFMPEFMSVSGGAYYNDSLTAIANEVPAVFLVSATGANVYPDNNHWTYQGMKVTGQRMIDSVCNVFGLRGAYFQSRSTYFLDRVETPVFSPPSGSFETSEDVTITCGTIGATVHYTVDGSVPDVGDTVYSTPLEFLATTTLKAFAVKAGMLDSAVVTGGYTLAAAIPDPGYDLVATDIAGWTDLVACTSLGSTITASGTGGGRSTVTIDPTKAFKVEVDWPSSGSSNASVLYLDDVEADTYQWTGDQVFIVGPYNYEGGAYVANGGYSANAAGSVSYPAIVRMVNDGNDIVIQKSNDLGVNWSTIYTSIDALLNRTEPMYLKSIFAIGSGHLTVRVGVET